MRAKTISKQCYVFDFDDTIIQSDAKIHIIKNGKRINSLNAEQHKTYKLKKGEIQDFSDLYDPRILMQAKKYKMWPELERISNLIKMGDNIGLYILTARSSKSQLPIFNFLKREKICIDLEHVITVGNDDGNYINTSILKKDVLQAIKYDYDLLYFFDDCKKNIKQANLISGIRTRLID